LTVGLIVTADFPGCCLGVLPPTDDEDGGAEDGLGWDAVEDAF